VQTFERFEWCAIRWMQLTVRGAPDGVVFRGLGANLVNYPVEARGRFSSSDSVLDQLWAAGAYTLRQCMHDAWEDCPSREQRQWLGDVTVENLAGWAAFGPSVAPLTAKFLAQAAESQRPDGLTQMFAPGDHKTDGLLIPDWTLQWILAAGDHWRLTADLETIGGDLSLDPQGAGLVRAADRRRSVSSPTCPTGTSWTGPASAARARRRRSTPSWPAPSRVAADPGSRRGLAKRGRAARRPRAARSARRCRRGTGTSGAASMSTWSIRPPASASRAGLPARQRRHRALDRRADLQRIGGRLPDHRQPPPHLHRRPADRPGPATASGARGGRGAGQHLLQPLRLRRAGRQAGMLDVALAADARALWPDAGAQGRDHALGELRAHRQPLPRLLGLADLPAFRRMLGVAPAAPGFAAIRVSPDLAGLDWARGTCPTAVGDVAVRLERAGADLVAQVEAPAGVPLEFAAAPGLELVSQSPAKVAVREARFTRAV
jgi:alpha-L-rhamnosidase